DVQLLPEVLPHVGHVEQPRHPVECEAPRVAQSGGPDLGARARGPQKRVVGGDRVRVATVDVEAQQLAEQRAPLLAVAVRVPARSPVPHPTYSMPSGPNITSPPSWLAYGRAMKSRCVPDAGSARSGSPLTAKRLMRVSPCLSV